MPISARPSVHSISFCGIASLREVGFDSGKITGRSTFFAIARAISSVNAPGWPETPISTVGFAFSITSIRPMRLASRRDQVATSSRVRSRKRWPSWILFMPSTSRPSRSTA